MIKSIYDKRKYKRIILENKLEIILISDKDAERSSASMNVGVGCYQDPKDLPGLAHFLEHMIFMGTKKYPEENGFSDYLSKNGGRHNAYTSQINTNYYFDIVSQNFDNILDMFAQFFISPLFNKNSIDKEINAINSEHSKNLQSDIRRVYGVIREITNKNNPFHKFCTGSLETLQKDSVYKELINFYNTWYSSNIMKLVILDKKPIGKLEKLIIKLFSPIINKNIKLYPNKSNYFDFDFDKNNLQINIEPINNINNLLIIIPIKTNGNIHFKSNLHFVSKLLSYNGKNSISTFLKNKNLATDVSSDLYDNNDMTDTLLIISLDLTENGINKLQIIMDYMVSYIDKIRKYNKNEFEQKFKNLNKINIINFTFKSKEEAIDYTVQIAENMHFVDCKYYLVGNNIYHKFDYENITNIFKQMNNYIVCFVSKFNNNNIKFKEEQYYKTKYQIIKNKIKIKNKNKNNQISKYIKIPNNNQFVNIKFKIKNIKTKIKFPIRILQNNYLELWHKQDHTFNKPYCFINMELLTNAANSSPKHYVMGSLFSLIINTTIFEELYDAHILNMTIHVTHSVKGFNLKINAYNSIINILIDNVIKILLNKISLEDFELAKEQINKFYDNIKFRSPTQLAQLYLKHILISEDFSIEDQIKAIQKITYSDIIKYQKDIYKGMFAKILIQGNITQNESIIIANTIHKKLKYSELPTKPLKQVISFNDKKRYIYNMKCESEEQDSSILSVYQCGDINDELDCIVNIINSMLSDPFFDSLRTNEQLGYIVRCGILMVSNTINISFIVQSSVKSPIYIQNKIDEFIKSYYKILEKMKNKEFMEYIESAIDTNKMKYISLEEEFFFNKKEIELETFLFNRKQKNIKCIQKINKKLILEHYKKLFMDNYKNIIIHVHGKSSNNKFYKIKNKNEKTIKNINTFKKSQTK
jgi:insulysin